MENGFLKTSVGALCLTGGLVLLSGCEHTNYFTYRYNVDPCYPERYEFMARQEVRDAFAAQSYNGHVLDQTVWNDHFEPGTETLTPGGMDHLAYLARQATSNTGRSRARERSPLKLVST